MIDKQNLEQIKVELEKLNSEYEERYLAFSQDRQVLDIPHSLEIRNSNNTNFNLDYFDLAVANLLLRELDDSYELSHNTVELITRLAYEGLRNEDILNNDYCRKSFCETIALNKFPDKFHVYDYSLWMDRQTSYSSSCWFYYTLLLWVVLDRKLTSNLPYISRIYITIMAQFNLTEFKTYEGDRLHDVLMVRVKLNKLLLAITSDQSLDSKFVYYLVNAYREFSLIVLSTILKRSCKWDMFKQLGIEVNNRLHRKHQLVVDKHYRQHKQHKESSK